MNKHDKIVGKMSVIHGICLIFVKYLWSKKLGSDLRFNESTNETQMKALSKLVGIK